MKLTEGPSTGLIEGSHPNWNEQLTVSLKSLSGRKERSLHSQVHISACAPRGHLLRPGTPPWSERGVLIVDGPQVAPGGRVHFIV